MNSYLIGVTGKAGVGKSTFVDVLANYYSASGKDVYIAPLAGPLKTALSFLLNVNVSKLESQASKNTLCDLTGKTYRELMQLMGTEFCRKYLGEDFWLKRMDRTLETAHYYHTVIIPDIRFDNEAQYVKNKGGIVIEITRPNNDCSIESTHASEKGISNDLIDYTINNDGNLYFYEAKIKTLLSELIK